MRGMPTKDRSDEVDAIKDSSDGPTHDLVETLLNQVRLATLRATHAAHAATLARNLVGHRGELGHALAQTAATSTSPDTSPKTTKARTTRFTSLAVPSSKRLSTGANRPGG